MPTYEYACRDCGEHLEVVQSFRDDPLTVCPACHGRLRKVFSAAGIVFKGSGWHIKDYASSRAATDRDKGGSERGGKEGSKKPEGAPSGEKKTAEAKGEKKTA
ncbi:MAG TPA: FmdB family zinc ribbon protein [Nitriliruptorales bacterium]|nr:FmdB family zinc ribbon protein [Nitriliruptorales bacterium]